MKNLSRVVLLKSIIAIFIFNLIQVFCLGQDSQSGTSTTVKTTTTEHTEWYAAPWVWIVGGVLVIVLLIAIVGGGRGSSSRTTISEVGGGSTTRTITTDSDEA